MIKTRTLGLLACAGYIATIFAANWAIEHWGITSVGFGLVAPAGVWFVGLAFTFRDLTQRYLGVWPVFVAILIGAFLSWFVAPTFAVASGIAFLVSELADLMVYTPISKRNWLAGVLFSNICGLVLDSVIFLQLAFHNQDFLKGQIVGKAWMTAAAVLVLMLARPFLPRPIPSEA